MKSASAHPFPIAPTTGSAQQLPLIALAALAIALPALLAFNVPPSATFLNQAAALAGWGAFVLWATVCWPPQAFGWAGTAALPALATLAVLALSALGAHFAAGLPSSLALSSFGLIAEAALVLGLGALLGRSADADAAFGALCMAMLLAGLLSLGVALIQYFIPQWADGNWIAKMATPGRAGGNLRQPNHLSSLLLWSMAALVWLHEAHIERPAIPTTKPLRTITALLMYALAFGVVLTVSRTGTVCVVLLAVWGVVDKRLSRFSRVLLWLTPLVYVLCWVAMSDWGQASAHAFAGDVQLHKSDPSSSRFGIWANTLSLIARHPWFGVGWGEFNFAWTLTPFPGRPGAFFDHTHNLPLQFLVELGLPLGTLVLALLAYALWKAFVVCREATEQQSTTVRTAFVMVLMMVVHSMLEYPLWYAYFLLPTAFALGVCLGHAKPQAPDDVPAANTQGVWLRRVLIAGAVAMMFGSAASLVDYLRVVAIFSPADDAAPLSTRIKEGQKSWFFAHHADYADVTTADHPSESMAAFKGATHYLLDTRLMLAWAKAFNEQGDVERARYIADRLREFSNPQSKEFFAECDEPRRKSEPLPFQCTPATKHFTYEDFR
jgi:O-antigen ligase